MSDPVKLPIRHSALTQRDLLFSLLPPDSDPVKLPPRLDSSIYVKDLLYSIFLNGLGGGTVAFADITGAASDNTSLATALADCLQISSLGNSVEAALQADIGTAGSIALIGANTFTGAQVISVNGAASTPALKLSGSWFTGGSSTTTKPQFLIEATGATSTAWNTGGTGIGVNAASGFAGYLIDLQLNGSTRFHIDKDGNIVFGSSSAGAAAISMLTSSGTITFGSTGANDLLLNAGIVIKASGAVRFGFTGGTDPILQASANQLELQQATLLTKLPTANPGPGYLWNNAGTPAIGT